MLKTVEVTSIKRILLIKHQIFQHYYQVGTVSKKKIINLFNSDDDINNIIIGPAEIPSLCD